VERTSKAPLAGQRWVSDTEPELGLGIILKANHSSADISFPAAKETRCYALESAPIRRVSFTKGEFITCIDGVDYEVLGIEEDKGIISYITKSKSIVESQLSDTMSFYSPFDRLHASIIDDPYLFKLRTEARYRDYALRRSPVRGYVGMRGDIIPHQISIASELCKRLHPRALLSDEVGLGKTIEACLVMHQLHLTGRAERILIILPEPLVNQWFVELLRKFNLLFSIFDEERCLSIEQADESNPFIDSQLVIASLDFFTQHTERAAQALEASWDLLIIDEVHHVEWLPDSTSNEYNLIESFSNSIPSVLLLSATPQQLGIDSHFGRLRLLDPQRFSSLNEFQTSSANYEELAQLIERITTVDELPLADIEWLEKNSDSFNIDVLKKSPQERRELVDQLLDRFGIGRVMFRNTRDHLEGFPKRIPHFTEIPESADSQKEKLSWLINLLKSHSSEKFLLITKYKETVENLITELHHEIKIDVAAFHEDLSLNQRDRNAAFFAKPEGARLLICSEIGSEGRNFQFCHHLIMWDLPDHPELLEQRIGRLDRIGQTTDINLHIPYIENSPNALLAKWYHEGLAAFEKTVKGADEIFNQMELLLNDAKTDFTLHKLNKLVVETNKVREQIQSKLSRGYDKLLELQSNRSRQTKSIIKKIAQADDSIDLEKFLVKLWDHFRLDVEELGNSSYFLKPGHVITDAFPNIPDQGITVTFRREIARSREDIGFISMDHPITRASFDLFLGSEAGNTSFISWQAGKEKALILEALYLFESIAPSHLHIDRFMPPTPVRVVIDHEGNDLSTDPTILTLNQPSGNIRKLMQLEKIRKELVPQLKNSALSNAKKHTDDLRNKAKERIDKSLLPEINRLTELAKVNPLVKEKDIEEMVKSRALLHQHIDSSRLRLDSIRLIWKE